MISRAVLALLCLNAVVYARPNVLVILTDDQGWGDLSLHGNTNLKTPAADSIGREGAQFRQFFVQPVCSPTRAEFLTGRYHVRDGIVGVSTGGERLNLGVRTIADHFRAAGYATACFGKWHNGSQYPYHPLGRGFDEYYGFTSGHWGDYFSPPLDHNGQTVVGNGFLSEDFANRAMAWMKQQEKPFLCYVAFNTPHSPMQVPDADWNRFKDFTLKMTGDKQENINHTRAALAMCENHDRCIGRLLDAVAGRDTIVVYFHDNGPNGRRWNGGMKGIKGSTDDGGTRSPLLIRWPGRIAAGTMVSEVAGAIDILPTLANLCDIKLTGDIDGISFAGELTGKGRTRSTRSIVNHWNGRVSVRTSTHRLDAQGLLFDMAADPAQTKPIDSPAIRDELLKLAENYKGLVKKSVARPYPVGYREMPRTVLPARDGVPHGKIQRSANAPNCSYFTNWTDAADTITWHVDVATAGDYTAIVHLTSTKAGSVLELTLGGAKCSGQIAAAHDPKPRGAENDRVPRAGESYVKDFTPLMMGQIKLPAGQGTLTLSAHRIDGAVEIRAVELILR